MVEIDLFIEHELENRHHDQITELRNAAFPDCRHQRSYHKQLPHFRLLALVDKRIVGHLGIDHRMIRIGDSPVSIFGMVDLCVDSEYRGNGIGGKMLTQADIIARRNNIEFLFLMASDHALYESQGFHIVDGLCSWLRIDEHRNYGVAVEEIRGEMMVKPTGDTKWPTGPIDLLGHMF